MVGQRQQTGEIVDSRVTLLGKVAQYYGTLRAPLGEHVEIKGRHIKMQRLRVEK